MITLNLKKTLQWVTTLITIILCVLMVIGVRQYQLHRHYGQVIEQSEKLLFHFDVVREHITQSLLDKNFANLAEAGQKIDSLNTLLRTILDDQHIAEEYKLIFINQVDLPGLVTLLHNAAALPLQQEQRSELARRIRELGDQFTLFNRLVANYAKSTLVNFQTMVIGSLALVLFLVLNILVLWHRQVGVPLLNLVRQAKNAAAGLPEKFSATAGSKEIADLSGSMEKLLLRHAQQVKKLETRETEHHFTTFLANSFNLLTATLLPDGTIIALNTTMEKFCGRPAMEVVGQKFQDIFLNQEERAVWEKTFHSFAVGESRENTFNAALRDRMRAQKYFMQHLHKAESAPATIVWIGLETSAPGRTEQYIDNSARNQEKQINAFAYPSFVLAENGQVLQANISALSCLGLQSAQMEGKDLAALLFSRPDTTAADSFRSFLTEKTPALLQTTFDQCKGNYLVAVLPFGHNVSSGSGRTLLLAIPLQDEPAARVTSLQDALSRQLAEQAEQVSVRVRTLSSDVEKYARVMATSFTQQEHGENQENLSEKIVLEGRRIAGIILEQGGRIAAIVEQLRTP